MHTDVHCTGQCNVGSKPNVLHFAVWILHDLLKQKFHAYVCLQEFSPFPITAITCDPVSSPDT